MKSIYALMNQLSIRTATIADAPILVQIGAQTFFETFAEQNSKEDMDKYLKETFALEKIISEIENRSFSFLLATDNNQIVGYAKLREDINGKYFKETNTFEIERIYVLKSHLSKGVGATLMQSSIDFAERLGFKIIWLGVWENNSRAINFYKRWGFKSFGTHVFILGNDPQTDILMKKEI